MERCVHLLSLVRKQECMSGFRGVGAAGRPEWNHGLILTGVWKRPSKRPEVPSHSEFVRTV